MKLSPVFPVICIAILLRLPAIFLLSMTGDEISTIFQANFPFSFMISRLATMDVADADIAPPFYFTILHLYLVLFPVKIWAIRLISLCFDLATILVTFYWLRSVLFNRVAVYASLFLACSPFLAWYAAEIRMYALVPFFSVLSTAALISYQQKKDFKFLLLYFLGACLGMYTQYYFFILLAAQGVTSLIFFRKKDVIPVILVYLLLGCSFIPWIPALLTDLKLLQTNSFPIPNSSIVTFLYIIIKLFVFGNRFFFFAHPELYVIGTLVLLFAALKLVGNFSAMHTSIKMITSICIVVITSLSIIALIKPETLRPHATIFLVPLVIILLAYLINEKDLLSKIARITILSVWGIVFILYNYNPQFTKPPVKRAAELIKNKSATIAEVAYDVGFNSPSYFTECFQEYYGKLPSEFNEDDS